MRDSSVHVYDGCEFLFGKGVGGGLEVAGPMSRWTWGDHCAHVLWGWGESGSYLVP